MRTGLEFDGRPVVIHGPNGAGKTNILEAISLLSPGRGLRRAATDEIARRPEALGWKLKAEVKSLLDTHEVETGLQDDGGRTVFIDGKTAPQAALGRIMRILWLVPAIDRLWIEAADGRRRCPTPWPLSASRSPPRGASTRRCRRRGCCRRAS